MFCSISYRHWCQTYWVWALHLALSITDTSLLSLQGKLDALWVLLRKGYDRVSVMRPQPGDKVPAPPNLPCSREQQSPLPAFPVGVKAGTPDSSETSPQSHLSVLFVGFGCCGFKAELCRCRDPWKSPAQSALGAQRCSPPGTGGILMNSNGYSCMNNKGYSCMF